MGISLFSLIATFGILFIGVHGLRCKCTQGSNKAPCQDGVCDVENGACLMLEHPTSGRLYACASSPMRDWNCAVKETKSGTKVKYCPCNGKDFCNYEKWPDSQDYDMDEDEAHHGHSNSSTNSSFNLPLLIVSFVFFFLMSLSN